MSSYFIHITLCGHSDSYKNYLKLSPPPQRQRVFPDGSSSEVTMEVTLQSSPSHNVRPGNILDLMGDYMKWGCIRSYR